MLQAVIEDRVGRIVVCSPRSCLVVQIVPVAALTAFGASSSVVCPLSFHAHTALEDDYHSKKPKISYVQLVARAVWEKQGHKAKVEEIYRIIMEKFPYFQNGPNRPRFWKNSVRSAPWPRRSFARLVCGNSLHRPGARASRIRVCPPLFTCTSAAS